MTLPLSNTVALITGASSGIGAATAHKLASLGASVALVARRRDRLEEVAGSIKQADGLAFVVEADITDKEQAIRAVEQVVATLGGLDIVVNCAGVMLIGTTEGSDVSDWDKMVEININGLLYTTHAALPHLLKGADKAPRKVTDLINVSSVGAFQINPINNVYSMTKAAVESFSESLRQEVTKRHVRVGVIEPGSVSTELASHNKPEVVQKILAPFFNDIQTLEPEDIADAVAYMVTRPRHATVAKLWVGPTEQV